MQSSKSQSSNSHKDIFSRMEKRVTCFETTLIFFFNCLTQVRRCDLVGPSHLIIFGFLTWNCWLLAALEALRGFEAVVLFFFQEEFLTTASSSFFLSNLCSLGKAVLLPFICIFHGIAADSALTEDYSPPGYHARRRFMCMAGKRDRGGGNTRVWDRGRIIVPRFRWVQPWSISWSQVQRWSAGSLAIAAMPCRMPTAAEMMWF